MDMIRISFIIPAYNEEHYLGDCLRSVREEIEAARADAEVIVVDNASTDKTAELANASPGVRVVHEPKKGLVQARSAGYQVSTGELIANIDADNILPHGWLGTVLGEFDRDPDMVGLSGPVIYYDLPRVSRMLVRGWYGLAHGAHTVTTSLGVGGVLQGGNFVVRRSALEAIGGYNMNLQFYGEDTDIARRMSRVGKVKFTNLLPIYTSGRRIKNEGLAVSAFKYALNYFSVIMFDRVATKKYQDIRLK